MRKIIKALFWTMIGTIICYTISEVAYTWYIATMFGSSAEDTAYMIYMLFDMVATIGILGTIVLIIIVFAKAIKNKELL